MDFWWETKSLANMTVEEWESLCDGCGKCCRIQLEDDERRRATTAVVCQYMDMEGCSCTVYERRTELVPECLKLTPDNLQSINWMPDTCAYRLVAESRPLPQWHPLISGDLSSTHRSGNSVRNQVIPETLVKEEDLEEFIIQWH